MRHGLLPALTLFLQPCNPGSSFFPIQRRQESAGLGGGGDAFVVCLMAVYTYMNLLHILAESGPEKKYLAFAVWSM